MPSDDFNRPGPDLGPNWISTVGTSGTPKITDGIVTGTGTVVHGIRWAGEGRPTKLPIYSEADWQGQNNVGLTLGMREFPAVGGGTTGSWYAFRTALGTGGVRVHLAQKAEGSSSFTALRNVLLTDLVIGDRMRVEYDGEYLRGFVNGVEALTPVVPTSPPSGLEVGFATHGALNGLPLWDNWQGGEMPSPIPDEPHTVVCTNYAFNPSFEMSSIRWANVRTAETLDESWSYSGDKSALIELTDVSASTYLNTGHPLSSPVANRINIQPGDTVRTRARVKAYPGKQRAFRSTISAYDITGTNAPGGFTDTPSIQLESDQEGWVVGIRVMPENAQHMLPLFTMLDGSTLGTPTEPGLHGWIDAVMVTINEELPEEYFDGDTPWTDEYLYYWTGTPHDSASVKARRDSYTEVGMPGHVAVGGLLKAKASEIVVLDGAKKEIASQSVIIDGVKYSLV